MRALHYDGRGADCLLGGLRYNNRPSRKHFPNAKDRNFCVEMLELLDGVTLVSF